MLDHLPSPRFHGFTFRNHGVAVNVAASLALESSPTLIGRQFGDHAVKKLLEVLALFLRGGFPVNVPAGYVQGCQQVQRPMSLTGALQGTNDGTGICRSTHPRSGTSHLRERHDPSSRPVWSCNPSRAGDCLSMDGPMGKRAGLELERRKQGGRGDRIDTAAASPPGTACARTGITYA